MKELFTHLKPMITVAVVLSVAAVALAQPTDLDEMTEYLQDIELRVRRQQEQLETMERRLAEQQATATQDPQPVPEGFTQAAEWLEDLDFFADLRLRYEGRFTEGGKDRHRARYRLRLGFSKTWLDEQLETAFRLASGNLNDPTSTNETFGGFFNRDEIGIDRAFARFAPTPIPGLTLIGGKMKNPLVHTNMVWDSDVNPEGLWGQYRLDRDDVSPFVNVGYWILDENATDHDVTMASYQVGADVVFDGVTWTIAGTCYDYDDYVDNFPDADGNPVSGGALSAGQFHLVTLTNKVRFTAGDLPVAAYVDYVLNCGDTDATDRFENEDSGYAAGLALGRRKAKGDWSVNYKYAWIEANATVGAFSDSDFGGVNVHGHVVGATYMLTDSLMLAGQLFRTSPIVADDDQARYMVQTDLVWKF
ncbi:MAG: putative porin [Planctomycetota bacterium]